MIGKINAPIPEIAPKTENSYQIELKIRKYSETYSKRIFKGFCFNQNRLK